MKVLMVLALLCSANFAKADGINGMFNSGSPWSVSDDKFRVLENSNGLVTLIDLQLGKVYSVNYKTGEESNLDIEFLKDSRATFVAENAQYVKSATIAAQKNSEGKIIFEIKAKIATPMMYSSGDFNALIVFKGEITQYVYNQPMPLSSILIANMQVDRLEDPAKSSSNSMMFAGLSLILKLYPKKGLYSVLYQN